MVTQLVRFCVRYPARNAQLCLTECGTLPYHLHVCLGTDDDVFGSMGVDAYGTLAKEAALTARETLEKARCHNAVGAQGWANLVLSFVAIQQGAWEEAERFARETTTLATMMHDTDLLARAFWGRSICAGWEGDWQRSLVQSLEALRISEHDGEISLVYPYLLLQAAKAYFYVGASERAQGYLDQALDFARTYHYRQLLACGYRLQGRILQAQGNFEQAHIAFEQSLAELADLHDEVEYARTQQAYGLYFQARSQADDQQRSEMLLQEASTLFLRLGVNG